MALSNAAYDIRRANGEILGLLYRDDNGIAPTTAFDTNFILNVTGWKGGWRIADTVAHDLLTSSGNGGGQDGPLFPRYPIMYVIETSTMKIVAGEKLTLYDNEDVKLDPVAEVQKINYKK